ncbi:TrmH family RNA methyltransferase [Brumimicrobium aurantiacum]|uniref:tRNA (guanosine(18)-2'-O)-methyltransferase n=1 Tax=Brumimicrobium aurantiacum TaxID=1737063 RepID=A0A3E1EZG8_9FLAO|nr:RNA methyltransferase [Brumimicrobium aurantiacum]RFC54948.1 TrmH family RNA methyltransferase [Brumimicrobium aurantiacum]
MQEKLLEALYQIITPEKVEKFERIAAERTRYATVAVENLFQEHNASAVMRSCDCFGIQDLHIIEQDNKFNVNRDIALGAGQWVDHHHYTDILYPTTTCITTLKEKGYKIAATTPHTDAYTINNVPLDEPIAFVFGTEQTGLSEKALDLADYYVKIPMVGFTESFNISVSAALTMNTIRTRLENMEGLNWKLTKEEQTALKIEWCKNIIRNPDNVIKDFIRRIKEGEL